MRFSVGDAGNWIIEQKWYEHSRKVANIEVRQVERGERIYRHRILKRFYPENTAIGGFSRHRCSLNLGLRSIPISFYLAKLALNFSMNQRED